MTDPTPPLTCYQCGAPIITNDEPARIYSDKRARYHVRCDNSARAWLDLWTGTILSRQTVLILQERINEEARSLSASIGAIHSKGVGLDVVDSFQASLDKCNAALADLTARTVALNNA